MESEQSELVRQPTPSSMLQTGESSKSKGIENLSFGRLISVGIDLKREMEILRQID